MQQKAAPLASLKAAPLSDPNAVARGKSKATPPVGKARTAGRGAVSQPVSVQPAVVQAAPVPTAPVHEAAPAAPARQELKVSGIAWQGKGESSFAVVNGRAVLQGASVDRVQSAGDTSGRRSPLRRKRKFDVPSVKRRSSWRGSLRLRSGTALRLRSGTALRLRSPRTAPSDSAQGASVR